jgi:hypothetical protein
MLKVFYWGSSSNRQRQPKSDLCFDTLVGCNHHSRAGLLVALVGAFLFAVGGTFRGNCAVHSRSYLRSHPDLSALAVS